ncbi:hypothetical protein [Gandjariella thermophila]|uniref:Uncharacterized protein n=1 Tax=Gandjariella thermophila TaxID=1931992 RepID=A0A4D4JA06_9PSEU|nr:hypothetical protein [Gandjariella thermophila]GDY30663.1 hypothetical protein GTS_22960 [Gandjariella thermophila]
MRGMDRDLLRDPGRTVASGNGRHSNMACSTCTTGLNHCHGTLIVHGDGLAECTDGQCADLDRARHALTIGCDEVAGGCGCAEPAASPLRHAS